MPLDHGYFLPTYLCKVRNRYAGATTTYLTPPPSGARSGGNYIPTPKIELNLKPSKCSPNASSKPLNGRHTASNYLRCARMAHAIASEDINSQIHDHLVAHCRTDLPMRTLSRFCGDLKPLTFRDLVSTTYLPPTPSRPAAAKTTYLPTPSCSYLAELRR